MTIVPTRPTCEQVIFESPTNGPQLLQSYLEGAEIGGLTLAELLDQLFGTDGVPKGYDFRVTNAGMFQYRVGTGAWIDLLDLDAATDAAQAAAASASASAAQVATDTAIVQNAMLTAKLISEYPFTGTGSQTVWTFNTVNAPAKSAILLTIDGVVQSNAAFTHVNSGANLVITFTEAPPLGSICTLRMLGYAAPIGTATLGGDVTGNSATTTVARIQGIPVTTVDPSLNQILRFDGTSWVPSEASLSSSVLTGDSSMFTDGRTGIMIPFYIYPSSVYSNTTVLGLLAQIRSHRTVPFIVIVNPSSGPGTVTDGNYTALIRVLKAAGARVVGYVSTAYAVRPSSQVLADIDLWLSLYPEISGIFLDEQSYDLTVGGTDAVALYASYTSYAHAHNLWPVVANPGTNQRTEYFSTRTADIIVVHENSTWPVEADMQGNYIGGHTDFSFTLRAAMIYAQSSITESQLRILSRYVQYVYISHDDLPNPWDSVSNLLEAQLLILEDRSRALTGDVVGAGTANTVTKLRNRLVASTAPSDLQYLGWNDTSSQWEPKTISATSSVTMGGDVTGASGTSTVAKIQGRTVASSSPSDLQYLGWNNGSSQWEPKTISATTSVTMAGDVSGNSATSSVDKLKGVAVSGTAPTSGQALVYSGSAWTPTTQPYDVPTYTPDKPTNSMIMARIVVVRAFTLPAALSGSQATAGTAATGSTTIDLQKNGVSFGTVAWSASGTTGTFTSASGATFAAGDVLRIVAPATADTTLADISITLAGTR